MGLEWVYLLRQQSFQKYARSNYMLTEQNVIDIIGELDINVDKNNITSDTTLKSLGIDSLDIFNLLVELETKTGKKIPDDDVDKLTTINAIVEYFS